MDAMEKARTPGPQHAYLTEQVGRWKVTVKAWVEGDTQIIELYVRGPDGGSAKVMELVYERP